ncbi:DivIVA domain-containing protein [Mycolicibacter longobardus]|uniref:DivIVA domain-containing protein n=1 Tax=Mycolicibacter longobardus TaxID=1108812 RepID=UPI000A162690|nr:DivIVA domain-containing protein [Mycolicibacter longobardus]MCV7382578.1 DivIVA domain-containing protein [Mycolicibacter longobardus]
MSLFGKRKRQSADTSPYEAPPIEHAGAARVAASPTQAGYGRLTAEDVRQVAFGKPRMGRRGYDEAVVDAFLDLVEAELDGPAPADGNALTPEQVETMVFANPPWGKRGYNEDQVDAFLERIAAELRYRAT